MLRLPSLKYQIIVTLNLGCKVKIKIIRSIIMLTNKTILNNIAEFINSINDVNLPVADLITPHRRLFTKRLAI